MLTPGAKQVFARANTWAKQVLAQCWHSVGTVFAQCSHSVRTVFAQCLHSVRTVLERKTSGVRTQPPPVYPFLAPPSPPTHPKVCFCFIRELVAFVWFRGSRASRANMGHTESRRQGVCRRCSSGSTRRRMTLQSKSGVAFSAASLYWRHGCRRLLGPRQGPRPPFTAQWRSADKDRVHREWHQGHERGERVIRVCAR